MPPADSLSTVSSSGPIRAEKIAKGIRFISHRSDFTLTQLTGHMSIESGNFEIVDAPGSLTLRTSSANVSIENPGGKVNVDNRNGNIDVRYSTAPKTTSSSPIRLRRSRSVFPPTPALKSSPTATPATSTPISPVRR